jgi:hypothetical protein
MSQDVPSQPYSDNKDINYMNANNNNSNNNSNHNTVTKPVEFPTENTVVKEPAIDFNNIIIKKT